MKDHDSVRRVSAVHVAWVTERLTERDRKIIEAVQRLRLVTSLQLERLYFQDLSPSARSRIRRRVLARLVSWRVLTTLDRRIGGERAGSAGYVYALDSAGQLMSADAQTRPRRPEQPGVSLVKHTLAVSELYVQLVELSRTETVTLDAFDTEPACWRPDGAGGWLKPDAYVAVSSAAFTDHWFIEMDLGTEHLPVIQRKASSYLAYLERGLGPNDVMPRVLFVAPDTQRCAAIAERLAAVPNVPARLFVCILAFQAGYFLTSTAHSGIDSEEAS
jgi:hypothetical protein